MTTYTDDEWRAVATDIKVGHGRRVDVDDLIRSNRLSFPAVKVILADMVYAGVLRPDGTPAAPHGRAAADLAVAWIEGGAAYRNHRRSLT